MKNEKLNKTKQINKSLQLYIEDDGYFTWHMNYYKILLTPSHSFTHLSRFGLWSQKVTRWTLMDLISSSTSHTRWSILSNLVWSRLLYNLNSSWTPCLLYLLQSPWDMTHDWEIRKFYFGDKIICQSYPLGLPVAYGVKSFWNKYRRFRPPDSPIKCRSKFSNYSRKGLLKRSLI